RLDPSATEAATRTTPRSSRGSRHPGRRRRTAAGLGSSRPWEPARPPPPWFAAPAGALRTCPFVDAFVRMLPPGSLLTRRPRAGSGRAVPPTVVSVSCRCAPDRGHPARPPDALTSPVDSGTIPATACQTSDMARFLTLADVTEVLNISAPQA